MPEIPPKISSEMTPQSKVADEICAIVNEWFQALPTAVEQQRDRSNLLLALIAEFSRAEKVAYRAGREDAARPALLAEVLYRYIDRVRERRAHSTQGQYHPEFYKGMKHAADLIAAGSLDAEIESRAAIRADLARGEDQDTPEARR